MARKRSMVGQRMMLGLIFILVACYTLYHLAGFFDTEMKTYAAGVTAEVKAVGGAGYLFRDETVLTASFGGVVDYQVENGVKVGEGQTLARVYQGGDEAERQRLRLLDARIRLIEESLDTGAVILDPLTLREEIRAEYLSLMNRLAEADAADISEGADEFLKKLNRMDVLVNEREAVCYETLSALREERSAILKSAGESKSYFAQQSGYFYTYTDGCEEWFTMDAASEEALSEEAFYAMVERAESATEKEGAFGKLCRSSEWRLVLPVSVEERAFFTVGQVYSATFGNGVADIPLTLEFVKDAPNHGQALLVFRADRMPDGFTFDRCQSVSMEVSRTEGLYVPKSVVVREEDGYGVYILRGSVVRLRYVEILYEGSDYYLVRADSESEDGRLYLAANDLIILNGRNLFDGRVMD